MLCVLAAPASAQRAKRRAQTQIAAVPTTPILPVRDRVVVPPDPFPAWVVPPEIEAAAKRTVKITSQRYNEELHIYENIGGGTGFIERTNRIITCEHLRIDFGSGIPTIFLNGKLDRTNIKYVARILVNDVPALITGTDMDHDIMVLATPTEQFEAIAWETVVNKSEPVTMIGNPLGLDRSITPGTITNFREDALFLDCNTLPGNSGSILINRWGKTVGMVFAKLPFVEIDRFGYARPAKLIMDLLKTIDTAQPMDKCGSVDDKLVKK
jgi:S1-C subfamily serine protease